MRKKGANGAPEELDGRALLSDSNPDHESCFTSEQSGIRQLVIVTRAEAGTAGQAAKLSHTIISIFAEAFAERKSTIKDPGMFLKEISLRAAAELMRLGTQMRDNTSRKATMSGFFRDGSRLYTVNVGDSRVILYRNSELTRLTQDHLHFVQNPDEEISVNSGESQGQQALSSHLGTSFAPNQLDVSDPLPLKGGDLILAFTRGIHDTFSDQEIVGLIKRYRHAPSLSEELIAAARQSRQRQPSHRLPPQNLTP